MDSACNFFVESMTNDAGTLGPASFSVGLWSLSHRSFCRMVRVFDGSVNGFCGRHTSQSGFPFHVSTPKSVLVRPVGRHAVWSGQDKVSFAFGSLLRTREPQATRGGKCATKSSCDGSSLSGLPSNPSSL